MYVYVIVDLQNVDITLRILYRPVADRLPDMFTNLGIDYAERVLPSIVNEVLKAVVVSTVSSATFLFLSILPYFLLAFLFPVKVSSFLYVVTFYFDCNISAATEFVA